ncbi:MAG: EamA family transporter [Bacillaceae bacterium]|nr:EamA family transporter [Bacillaceae bacterium]
MQNWGYVFVLAGAALWGLIGIFVEGLYELGFSSMQIVAVRLLSATIFLIVYLWLARPTAFRVRLRDWPIFVGSGILSIVFFNFCYFLAIRETSLSVAAILLYTGPAFVTVMSRIFFKEGLTPRKILSLILTFVGCMMVVEYLPRSGDGVSWFGFWVGIGSGLGYALYSIFGKVALRRYDTYTVTLYTFITASLFLIPAGGLWQSAHLFQSGKAWLLIGGLGLVPTVLAYLLYTYGLQKVESSRAAIAATIEPVVATLIGVSLFKEVLSIWQLFGVILVLLAVITVQESDKKSAVNVNS